jgi:hypothetical protein
MSNFWEQFILTTALGVLNGLKKNPLKDPKVISILQDIQTDLTEILADATSAA